MTIGMILLIITGLLVAFGAGQRALDRLRLTDRQAYVFIAAMISLGFVPPIPLGPVRINLGGCLIPLALCVYLFVKASAREKLRSALSCAVTGAAIWAIMRYLPHEPDSIPIEPNWLYGAAAAVIAYALGRSRRCAFIGGVTGMLLAQTASVIPVWLSGRAQTLSLGGAGAFDSVVVAGVLGVMLAELVGEIIERIVCGRKRPTMEFLDGEFVEGDRRK